MNNLNNKTVLVYDYGLCGEVALKLAEKFGKVYYYTAWQDAFPHSKKALIGAGTEVEKVNYFWDYVDKADLICFFDTYCADMVEFLKERGYRVFGAGIAEFLETNRVYFKAVMKTLELPVPEYRVISGIKELQRFFSQPNVKNYFVKLNSFRGDIETFLVKDLLSAKVLLDKLTNVVGPAQDKIQFVVEKKIEGVEPGYDGFVVDGKYPDYGMWGYEKKGSGYIGVIEKYDDMPTAIKLVNDKLANFFEQMGTRSFFSTEIRVDKDGIGYLIDPTIRCPMPVPTAIHLEIWDNLAEFIWEAANGNLIDLIPLYKFGCGVALDSEWANENWLEVEVDPAVRKYVKFRNFMMSNEKIFAVPGFSSVCAVIGLGNTVDEAIEMLKENVMKVSSFELSQDIGGIENVLDEIKEGESYGLPDFTKRGGK